MIKSGERSATGGPSLLDKLFSFLSERKSIREEAEKIAEKKRREKTIKDKYYAVARLFNALHCHTGDDLWMCPACNKLHPVDREKTKEWGWCTGIHYPKCCSFPAGHRLFYDLYATTGDVVKG